MHTSPLTYTILNRQINILVFLRRRAIARGNYTNCSPTGGKLKNRGCGIPCRRERENVLWCNFHQFRLHRSKLATFSLRESAEGSRAFLATFAAIPFAIAFKLRTALGYFQSRGDCSTPQECIRAAGMRIYSLYSRKNRRSSNNSNKHRKIIRYILCVRLS